MKRIGLINSELYDSLPIIDLGCVGVEIKSGLYPVIDYVGNRLYPLMRNGHILNEIGFAIVVVTDTEDEASALTVCHSAELKSYLPIGNLFALVLKTTILRISAINRLTNIHITGSPVLSQIKSRLTSNNPPQQT